MDGPSLIVSVLALVVSAVAAIGAVMSAKASLRSAKSVGRHRIAEFRQIWIDDVMVTLSEYIALTLTSPRERDREDNERMMMLVTKLRLLLDKHEEDHSELIDGALEILTVTDAELSAKAASLADVARKVIKAEWARIEAGLK